MPPKPMGTRPKMEKGRMKEVFGRLMGYILKVYKFQFFIVMVCVVVSAIGTAAGTGMLQTLIDDGITPQIGAANPDFTRLYHICITMAVVYGVVAFTEWLRGRLMINVTQGTLRTIRDEMMHKMQTLQMLHSY